MKAVYKNEKLSAQAFTGDNWVSHGKMLEKSGDNQAEIDLYNNQLRSHPHNIRLYDRLLILYRKEKAYKKEWALLNKAIRLFTGVCQPNKNGHSKKVAGLSKSILHAVGLIDKKGAALYHPQPIARWQKRLTTVKQKLQTR